MQRIRSPSASTTPQNLSTTSTPITPSPVSQTQVSSSRKRKSAADDSLFDQISTSCRGCKLLLALFAVANILQCKARDKNRCVLTHLPSPQVCHIYPFSMLKC